MAQPTVRDLLETPHLRLTLKGGGDGLDKPVTWAQTSDLKEPWSYLAGGELLMKNGQTLPELAGEQTALIRGVAENGMCGMVIGLDAATPELTSAAVTLADRLAFPLMVVPYSVGFASIGRAVADAAGSGRVAVTERVYNVIRQSVSNSGPANVLAALERDLSCRIAVLDASTGAVALEASDRPLVVSNVDLTDQRVGGLGTDLVARFLDALAHGAHLNLHVRLLEGRDPEHVLDAIFKALGAALGLACRPLEKEH